MLFYKMPVDRALASVVYGFFRTMAYRVDYYRRGLRLVSVKTGQFVSSLIRFCRLRRTSACRC
ncbi:hypothetical protein MJ561_28085 [Klebsiella pneumoniae]|nr:hypothetical protein MJ561_28085 [Klebsiella pneumoniae]